MNDLQEHRASFQWVQRLRRSLIESDPDRCDAETLTRKRASRRKLVLVGLGVGVVIALALIFGRPETDAAMKELKAAADATTAYRGWMHVKIVNTPVVPPQFLATTEMHYNTADRRFVGVLTLNDHRCVKMIIPGKNEQWLYGEAGKELAITSSSEQSAIAMMTWGADDPLKLANLLQQWDVHDPPTFKGLLRRLFGAKRPKGAAVTRTEEEGFIRFDLTPPANYTPAKTTYWCDRTTKLIRRIDHDVGGNRVLLEYSYGAPDIREIYDMGVPRDVHISDTRDQGSFGADPVVAGAPDMSKLTKDDAFDLKGFVGRLQTRMDADYGDFVMIECEERLMPYSRSSEGTLAIEGRQGVMGLMASYALGPSKVFSGGPGFPNGWPTPKFADVLGTMTRARPWELYAFDGTTGRWNNQAGPQPMNDSAISSATARKRLSLARKLWPIRDIELDSPTQKVEALKDGNRPHLIVLHMQASEPMGFRNASAGGQRDATYWFDPQRDDLLVESYQRAGDAGDNPLPLEHRRVRMRFAQLANGRWYPTQEQFRSTTPQPGRAMNEPDYVNVHRQLLERETLPANWYSDPSPLLMPVATTRPLSTR